MHNSFFFKIKELNQLLITNIYLKKKSNYFHVVKLDKNIYAKKFQYFIGVLFWIF